MYYTCIQLSSLLCIYTSLFPHVLRLIVVFYIPAEVTLFHSVCQFTESWFAQVSTKADLYRYLVSYLTKNNGLHGLRPIWAALWAQGQHLHHREVQLMQLKQDIVGMLDCQESLFFGVSKQFVQLSAYFQRLSPSTHVSSLNTMTVSVSPPLSTTPTFQQCSHLSSTIG